MKKKDKFIKAPGLVEFSTLRSNTLPLLKHREFADLPMICRGTFLVLPPLQQANYVILSFCIFISGIGAGAIVWLRGI